MNGDTVDRVKVVDGPGVVEVLKNLPKPGVFEKERGDGDEYGWART